jgi:hypothetical protein
MAKWAISRLPPRALVAIAGAALIAAFSAGFLVGHAIRATIAGVPILLSWIMAKFLFANIDAAEAPSVRHRMRRAGNGDERIGFRTANQRESPK